MFCPHCGSRIPDEAKFCPECGYDISQVSFESAESGPQATQYPNFNQTSNSPVPPHNDYQSTSYNASYNGYASGTSYASTRSSGMPGPLRVDRDIWIYILLSIVTCGIYSYWYIYQMAQDTNIICHDDGEETQGLAVFILLSIITCGIYSYYWMYKLEERLQYNGPRYGVPIQERGSDILLWLVLGIFTCGICYYFGLHILMQNLNKLSEAYNRVNGF